METKFTGGEWKVKSSPDYHEPKSSTIEILSPTNRLKIVDLPTFGLPTKATTGIFLLIISLLLYLKLSFLNKNRD